MGEMERLYGVLAFPGFDAFRPKLQAYVESLRSYRKNRYERLPEEVRRQVAAAWKRSFEAWGYPLAPVEPVEPEGV